MWPTRTKQNVLTKSQVKENCGLEIIDKTEKRTLTVIIRNSKTIKYD